MHLESKTLTLLGFVSGVMLLLARFAPDVASYRLLEGSVMYAVSVLFGLCELSLSGAVLFLFVSLRQDRTHGPSFRAWSRSLP